MACARGSRVAGTAPTRGAFGRGTTWQRQPKGAAAAVLVHVGFLLALAAAQPDTLNSVGSKNSSAAVQHNHTEVVTDAGELLAALQRFVQLSREEARRNTNSNKTVRSPPSPPPPPNLATQRGEVTHDDHQRMFHIRSLSCTFTIFVRGLIRVNATAWNRTASSSLVVVRAGTLCIQGDVQDSDSQIAVIDTGGLADATPLFMDPARLVLLDVIIVNRELRRWAPSTHFPLRQAVDSGFGRRGTDALFRSAVHRCTCACACLQRAAWPPSWA